MLGRSFVAGSNGSAALATTGETAMANVIRMELKVFIIIIWFSIFLTMFLSAARISVFRKIPEAG